VLILEAEEALWVEYKKPPIWGVGRGLNILLEIWVKCKKPPILGSEPFPGETRSQD
jgi:hypothetical protein